MKIRTGFVSNSSSSSFIITNKTDKPLKLVNFVEENPELIKEFVKEYDWYEEDTHNQEAMIECAITRDAEGRSEYDEEYNETKIDTYFKVGDNKVMFGDEDGDLIGRVYDYILRNGGESKSFKWKFHEHCR